MHPPVENIDENHSTPQSGSTHSTLRSESTQSTHLPTPSDTTSDTHSDTQSNTPYIVTGDNVNNDTTQPQVYNQSDGLPGSSSYRNSQSDCSVDVIRPCDDDDDDDNDDAVSHHDIGSTNHNRLGDDQEDCYVDDLESQSRPHTSGPTNKQLTDEPMDDDGNPGHTSDSGCYGDGDSISSPNQTDPLATTNTPQDSIVNAATPQYSNHN